MIQSLRQIIRELFTEKTRIILTILAIAWGTFAISSMLAVGEGLRVTFAKAVAGAGQNLLVLSGGKTSKVFRGLPANRTVNLSKLDFKSIKFSLPNIALISPEYVISKSIAYKKQTINPVIQGVAGHYDKIHAIEVQPGGRFISPLDIKKRAFVVVLGVKAIEQLFADDVNPIGKKVLINKQPFLVIGTMKPKTQMISTEGPDEYLNWIPYSTYELMFNPQAINNISIQSVDAKFIEQMKEQVQKIIALNHNADPDDDSIITFTDVAKQQQTINDFFFGMQIFLGIVGALTLMVAGVGIANVMFASVSRATHEIGIRMAVGARKYQIVMKYVIEALLVTFIGGIVGLIMSALLVVALRFIPIHGRFAEAIGQPHPVLSLTVIIVVVLVLGLVGFLAGLFPALKAASVDPSEALRYE